MKRESRGEEQLVSCCRDGDVVDVGEGNGGGFGEGRKGEKAERVDAITGCEFANASKKKDHSAGAVYSKGHLTAQWGDYIARSRVSKGLFSCRDSKINVRN